MTVKDEINYDMMRGYWARTFVASNGVTVGIDELGELTLTRGFAGASISVPLEDLRLILNVYSPAVVWLESRKHEREEPTGEAR